MMKLSTKLFKMPFDHNLKTKWYQEKDDLLKLRTEWWTVVHAKEQLTLNFNQLRQTSSDALSELEPLLKKAEVFGHQAREKLRK
ncbi:hypothetical protein [Limosilactobacillus alvi]|nr:hypothetical protein [Limosilactobacillus alvi]